MQQQGSRQCWYGKAKQFILVGADGVVDICNKLFLKGRVFYNLCRMTESA